MNRLKFFIVNSISFAFVLVIFLYFIVYHSSGLPIPKADAATTCTCVIDGPTCVSRGGTPSGPGACPQGISTFEISCCITTCPASTVCSAWSAPSNTCYNGNYTQNCTETFTNCSTTSWTNSSTIDACITPQYGCVGAVCVPYWTISGTITDVDGNGSPGIPVDCAGHGASGGAFFFGYGDQIRTGGYTCSISLPGNYIATTATSRGVSVGPNATGVDFGVARVFSISGNVIDDDGNGTPSIPVTCAGHSASGGPFTFGYGDHIRRGSYTCSISLPANYIPLGPTSIGVSVGPDRTGVDFHVARVFSISGSVIDDDGNGTPSIPVTCAGHSASGGPFTFGYGLHIRRGSYTCSIALPANYIPLGPTSIGVTVGPDKTGVDFHVARVFSISGSVIDDDGNGTPAIPVTCAGHGASGGPFTFGYGLHIRRGSYTCSIALPANYIPLGPTSIGVTVGPDKTGVDFHVARVFSISGSITDVDGNGTPSIVVTCAGFSASGGPFTFGYGLHIRRGSYTCSIALPANYITIGPTSIAVTVGPDRTGVDFTVARVFSISGTVTDPLNGDAGVGGVQISAGGTTVATVGSGAYTIPYTAHLRRGTHTVTMTIPAGWTNTTVTSRAVTVGPDATGIDFGVTKLFSASGNVFVDPNINGLEDFGEVNYTLTPAQMAYTATILPIANFQPTPGSPFATPNGAYTINQLVSGPLTVFFTPPPPLPRWYMTSPLNGPPPRFNVTIGYNCDTNGAPGAVCTNGNITDLDFGMTDNTPWFQSTCGDIRNDDGISDTVPKNYYANVTDATCTNPGITFTGDTDASFGDGQGSTSQQQVGGFAYPELFSTTTQPETSYTNLLAKTQAAGITPVSLSTVCQGGSLTPCTLDPGLSHNVYQALTDVTLNGFTFPGGQNYVILINGNLTIAGPITVPVGSTVIFSVSGNIIVDPAVGKAPTDPSSSLDGWYIAGQSFILPSAGLCQDLRLTIGGTVIVNAMGGGTFQNDRNLCRFNAVDPAVGFTQRLDMILNAPQFLKQQTTVSQELAP